MSMDRMYRTERLQVMLDPEELQLIDDWRFDNRMPSRASAIRELLRRGLHAEGFAPRTAHAGRKSESFGVGDSDAD